MKGIESPAQVLHDPYHPAIQTRPSWGFGEGGRVTWSRYPTLLLTPPFPPQQDHDRTYSHPGRTWTEHTLSPPLPRRIRTPVKTLSSLVLRTWSVKITRQLIKGCQGISVVFFSGRTISLLPTVHLLASSTLYTINNAAQVLRYPRRQFKAKESAFTRRDSDILKALSSSQMGVEVDSSFMT